MSLEIDDLIVLHPHNQPIRVQRCGLTIRIEGEAGFDDLVKVTGIDHYPCSIPDYVHSLPPRHENGWTLFDFVSDRPFYIGKFISLYVPQGATLPFVN